MSVIHILLFIYLFDHLKMCDDTILCDGLRKFLKIALTKREQN